MQKAIINIKKKKLQHSEPLVEKKKKKKTTKFDRKIAVPTYSVWISLGLELNLVKVDRKLTGFFRSPTTLFRRQILSPRNA